MSATANPIQLLTPSQAAQRIHVSAAHLRLLASRGLVACTKTAGGHRRYRADDLDAYLESGHHAQPAAAAPDAAELDKLMLAFADAALDAQQRCDGSEFDELRRQGVLDQLDPGRYDAALSYVEQQTDQQLLAWGERREALSRLLAQPHKGLITWYAREYLPRLNPLLVTALAALVVLITFTVFGLWPALAAGPSITAALWLGQRAVLRRWAASSLIWASRHVTMPVWGNISLESIVLAGDSGARDMFMLRKASRERFMARWELWHAAAWALGIKSASNLNESVRAKSIEYRPAYQLLRVGYRGPQQRLRWLNRLRYNSLWLQVGRVPRDIHGEPTQRGCDWVRVNRLCRRPLVRLLCRASGPVC